MVRPSTSPRILRRSVVQRRRSNFPSAEEPESPPCDLRHPGCFDGEYADYPEPDAVEPVRLVVLSDVQVWVSVCKILHCRVLVYIR